MLKMSRKGSVGGFHGPTVETFNSPGWMLGNQRLDGDHKTIPERLRIERIVGVRNDGVFMDNPTYPVPRKLADDPESLSLYLVLYGMADAIDRFVRTSYGHCLIECRTGTLAQSSGFRRARRNRDGDCRICNIAVQFSGDIQAYNVTLFQHSITRNTVNDLVVDAD